MNALRLAFDFVTMECGECGIAFAITQAKYDRCKHHGEGWHCPNGHSRIFIESDVTKLKNDLEKEIKRREWAETARNAAFRRESALRGVVTRTKNRIKNGVCPCCKRSFQNLKRHMSMKHSAYGKEK